MFPLIHSKLSFRTTYVSQVFPNI